MLSQIVSVALPSTLLPMQPLEPKILRARERASVFEISPYRVAAAQSGPVMIAQTITLPHPQPAKTKKRIWPGLILPDRLAHLWSVLTGRSGHLLALAEVEATCTILDYTYLGRQRVSLDHIRGSASLARCGDFDANFRPRQGHTADRWQRIAAARRRGAKLPPVVLIRVGQVYFVEDGHHRISVAKAQGDQDIEAIVTVLHVAGAWPCEIDFPLEVRKRE